VVPRKYFQCAIAVPQRRSYVRLRYKSKKLLCHQSHFPCGLVVGKSLMFLAIVPRARLDRLTD